MSKSTENLIRLWKPNPARKPDAAMILREFKMVDAEIWFVRFLRFQARKPCVVFVRFEALALHCKNTAFHVLWKPP